MGEPRGGRESTIRGCVHAATVLHTARHETHDDVSPDHGRGEARICTPYELLRIRVAPTRLLARTASSFGRHPRPPRRHYGGRRGSLRRGLRALRDYRQVSNPTVRRNETAAPFGCVCAPVCMYGSGAIGAKERESVETREEAQDERVK